MYINLFVFIANTAFSQETIKTITAFKKKTNYAFTSEWQYLSTDLYLLNATKFSNLLNDIAAANSAKKIKKLSNETLQSLFIRAKIKNVRFFGGDIVYPIYNFRVTEGKNNTLVETGNVEVVRLIDNLPLNESNEVIDAEISGEAITQKNTSEFLQLIGTQLQNISKISKPNLAILDLIGELGKFIESKTTGKHYKFSSTIRLYEGQDFNKRLHSVNIFVLAPSSTNKVNVLAENLNTFLDTSSNPLMDQQILDRLVAYKKYPLIITANYKSRYNSHPVIGDQINYEYLNERKLKINNAYQNELINKYTYNQELKLIEFLEIFSELKLNINNYKLNLKNNITDDYSKNLFVILKIYRDLLHVKKMRIIEFSNNPEFYNEFLPKYESVLNTAGIYLNENSALINLKESAELIDSNSNPVNYSNVPDLCEKNLRALYSLNIPEEEQKSTLSMDIIKLAGNIEHNYYSRSFAPLIKLIDGLPADDNGIKEKEKIESQYGNTHCKLCKTEFNKTINNYNIRYQNTQTGILIRKNEEINQQAVSLLFKSFEKRKCIDNFLNSTKKDSLNTFNDLITIEVTKIDTLIKETRETLKTSITGMNAEQLKEHNFLLDAYIKRLESGLLNFCSLIKGICDCRND